MFSRGYISRLRRFGVLLAVSVLAACQGSTQLYTQAEAQHENQLTWVNLTHEVRFEHMIDKVAGAEDERLAAFLEQVGASHTDTLIIDTGNFGGEWADIRVRNIENTLRKQVPGGRPQRTRVGRDEFSEDIVRVIVGRYLVTTPRCPNWSKPSHRDPLNQPSSNFGCSTTANLGLMVADPADLVRGRRLGPADGTAMMQALQRYRAGRIKQPASQSTSGGEN